MIRLASVAAGTRDGSLVVVGHDMKCCMRTRVPTMQAALDEWDHALPEITACAETLEAGGGQPLDASLLAPLPRAYQYCEGSTYLSHMERGRAARKAGLPPRHGAEPAVFQGASDRFLAPTEPIRLGDVSWDLDFEATVGAIVGDVPAGVSVSEAASYIRLLVLINDLTLRAVLPREFEKGLGFVQAKPLRAFAPLAVTPDGLGADWDGLLHASVRVWLNDELVGSLDSGKDASFGFADIIAYSARTRPLAAGTIVSTGTISNTDARAGFGCLIEKRAMQTLDGLPLTRYLRPGDRVRIEAFDSSGDSIFGAIDSPVTDTTASPKRQ
ncbi:fumarylacetoacetate hydrolase family protein [[Mycobacterium] nativiensis]|uniref:Fumarylacetoacetate hydrolase family protein n=1 Tax=[Mycobacterium] nativiensis TaxID=2855503 RepID=A0ABU5XV06_9MYCO|nr:fumarylacetoacetate hydrolase family protein [Mycolicibacter sp. MYC340]MEB3031814.1 fumarylacetoacetate hydrolase family protein [Mycolicibacter sp. MYC340]